ncbi:MAG: hypothetical protein R3C68_09005 [Myxococcota bacterium]
MTPKFIPTVGIFLRSGPPLQALDIDVEWAVKIASGTLNEGSDKDSGSTPWSYSLRHSGVLRNHRLSRRGA